MAGYPINWGATGTPRIASHPLYIKYNSTPFSGISLAQVKADLGGVMATADNAEICFYLSWLIRTLNLLA